VLWRRWSSDDSAYSMASTDREPAPVTMCGYRGCGKGPMAGTHMLRRLKPETIRAAHAEIAGETDDPLPSQEAP